ncbi:MAG: hypothetical protein ABSE99_15900 [Terracidiphilus sp.]
MPEQFVNPEATKLENETVSDVSAQKKVNVVADKAAARPAKTEQRYDKENNNLFSK